MIIAIRSLKYSARALANYMCMHPFDHFSISFGHANLPSLTLIYLYLDYSYIISRVNLTYPSFIHDHNSQPCGYTS